MIRKRDWHIRDKWKRHMALARHRPLQKHIPHTQLLNEKNLAQFSKQYKSLFIKPTYAPTEITS